MARSNEQTMVQVDNKGRRWPDQMSKLRCKSITKEDDGQIK